MVHLFTKHFRKRNVTEAKVVCARVCKGKGSAGKELQVESTSLGFFTDSNTRALALKLLASSQLITFPSIGRQLTRACFTQDCACKNGDKLKSAFNNLAHLVQLQDR